MVEEGKRQLDNLDQELRPLAEQVTLVERERHGEAFTLFFRWRLRTKTWSESVTD